MQENTRHSRSSSRSLKIRMEAMTNALDEYQKSVSAEAEFYMTASNYALYATDDHRADHRVPFCALLLCPDLQALRNPQLNSV